MSDRSDATAGIARPGIWKPETTNSVRVEYLPLSSLKLAKRNPKKHECNTIIRSMGRFGYVAPMILDERTGRLVTGHGRLESLQKAKAEGKEPPHRKLALPAIPLAGQVEHCRS